MYPIIDKEKTGLRIQTFMKIKNLRYKAGILGYSIAEMKALQIVLNRLKRVAAGTFVCYNGDT